MIKMIDDSAHIANGVPAPFRSPVAGVAFHGCGVPLHPEGRRRREGFPSLALRQRRQQQAAQLGPRRRVRKAPVQPVPGAHGPHESESRHGVEVSQGTVSCPCIWRALGCAQRKRASGANSLEFNSPTQEVSLGCVKVECGVGHLERPQQQHGHPRPAPPHVALQRQRWNAAVPNHLIGVAQLVSLHARGGGSQQRASRDRSTSFPFPRVLHRPIRPQQKEHTASRTAGVSGLRDRLIAHDSYRVHTCSLRRQLRCLTRHPVHLWRLGPQFVEAAAVLGGPPLGRRPLRLPARHQRRPAPLGLGQLVM